MFTNPHILKKANDSSEIISNYGAILAGKNELSANEGERSPTCKISPRLVFIKNLRYIQIQKKSSRTLRSKGCSKINEMDKLAKI